MQHYTQIIDLGTIPAMVIYEALTTGINKWWTEMLEGTARTENAVFTIRFGEQVCKTIKVQELVPGNKVVWYVTAAMIDIPELNNKQEWAGTTIEWRIRETNAATQLQLTHMGLTPEVECYRICEAGWQNFTGSLALYVTTGKGNPFKPAL